MEPKAEKKEKEINASVIYVAYDDGENISCRKAPEKPFDGWPMPIK